MSAIDDASSGDMERKLLSSMIFCAVSGEKSIQQQILLSIIALDLHFFFRFIFFRAILVFAGWPQAAFVSFTAVFRRVWMNKKCHLILSRDCVFISASFLLLVKRRGVQFRDKELDACEIKFVVRKH